MDHDPVKLTICGAERYYLGDSAKLNTLEIALAEAFRLGLRRCCSRGPYWRIQTPESFDIHCGYFYCPHCQVATTGQSLERAIDDWNHLPRSQNNYTSIEYALQEARDLGDIYETEVYD